MSKDPRGFREGDGCATWRLELWDGYNKGFRFGTDEESPDPDLVCVDGLYINDKNRIKEYWHGFYSREEICRFCKRVLAVLDGQDG